MRNLAIKSTRMKGNQAIMFVIDKVNNVRGKLVSVFKNSNVATLGLEKSRKKDLDYYEKSKKISKVCLIRNKITCEPVLNWINSHSDY